MEHYHRLPTKCTQSNYYYNSAVMHYKFRLIIHAVDNLVPQPHSAHAMYLQSHSKTLSLKKRQLMQRDDMERETGGKSLETLAGKVVGVSSWQNRSDCRWLVK